MQGLAPAGVCGVDPNTPKTVFLFILCIVLFSVYIMYTFATQTIHNIHYAPFGFR